MADKILVAQVFPGSLAIAAIINCWRPPTTLRQRSCRQSSKDPSKGGSPGKVALYRGQQLGGYRVADIMSSFGLSNSGSVSFITTQIRKQRKDNKECVQTLQQ